ncbi:hypothetical protein [Deinococcus frigens]|uniref:hypothetical protein n=1 Tax=Deinococcus frigens TaxID=249403 RepID=UPI000496F748|nr:hypothetical protein [Deinococcus frigens]
MSGWNNPTIYAGQTRIAIETNDWRVLDDLYSYTLRFSGPQLNAGAILNSLNPDRATEKIAFTGIFESGGIYALITPTFGYWSTKTQGGEFLNSGNIILTSNINQARPGRVEFRSYNDDGNFKFFSSIDDFQLALDPYRGMFKTQKWDAQHLTPALILKLSGHFGPDAYTVVSPKTVTRQP